MFQAAVIGLGIVLALVTQECTIDNIGDFVNTYSVTVTNDSDEDVYATILMPDSRGTIRLAPGATATESGFKRGDAQILATNFDMAKVTELRALKSELIEKARNPNLRPDEVESIWQEIRGLDQRMSASRLKNEIGSGFCTAGLSTKKAVVASIVVDVDRSGVKRWGVSC